MLLNPQWYILEVEQSWEASDIVISSQLHGLRLFNINPCQHLKL